MVGDDGGDCKTAPAALDLLIAPTSLDESSHRWKSGSLLCGVNSYGLGKLRKTEKCIILVQAVQETSQVSYLPVEDSNDQYNKPGAQAAAADTSRCCATNKQNPPLQLNGRNC